MNPPNNQVRKKWTESNGFRNATRSGTATKPHPLIACIPMFRKKTKLHAGTATKPHLSIACTPAFRFRNAIRSGTVSEPSLKNTGNVSVRKKWTETEVCFLELHSGTATKPHLSVACAPTFRKKTTRTAHAHQHRVSPGGLQGGCARG